MSFKEMARAGDPITSKEAAAALAADPAKITLIQSRVLGMLTDGPATHEELVAQYRHTWGPIAESSVRTRCRELVRMGWVEDSGLTKGEFGRRKTVWRKVLDL